KSYCNRRIKTLQVTRSPAPQGKITCATGLQATRSPALLAPAFGVGTAGGHLRHVLGEDRQIELLQRHSRRDVARPAMRLVVSVHDAAAVVGTLARQLRAFEKLFEQIDG